MIFIFLFSRLRPVTDLSLHFLDHSQVEYLFLQQYSIIMKIRTIETILILSAVYCSAQESITDLGGYIPKSNVIGVSVFFCVAVRNLSRHGSQDGMSLFPHSTLTNRTHGSLLFHSRNITTGSPRLIWTYGK